jgi:hypothetical protein
MRQIQLLSTFVNFHSEVLRSLFFCHRSSPCLSLPDRQRIPLFRGKLRPAAHVLYNFP